VSPNPSTGVPMATLILGLIAVDVSRVGGAENDGQENDGQGHCRGWKMQDWN